MCCVANAGVEPVNLWGFNPALFLLSLKAVVHRAGVEPAQPKRAIYSRLPSPMGRCPCIDIQLLRRA